jgi:antitoxin Phd
MKTYTNSLVSMTEANQNFSKVARMVDELGSVIILKNNKPRYVILDFNQVSGSEEAQEESVMVVSERIMQKNYSAYKKLAE